MLIFIRVGYTLPLFLVGGALLGFVLIHFSPYC